MSLQAVNISKFFGSRQALDGVSFAVKTGESVGLLGGPKSGKSTIMRLLAGYYAPTNGRVVVNGGNPTLAVTRRAIGYLPESTPLPPIMRVREFFRLRAALKGMAGRRDVRDAIEAVADLCPVEELFDRLIGSLAPAERQWVGLADALLAKPPILLLDNPTAGLDARQAEEVRDVILSSMRKTTVVVASRVPGDIDSFCRRVIVMDSGRVAVDDEFSAVYRDYVEERTVVLTLISSEPVREAFRAVPGVRTVAVTQDSDNLDEMNVTVTIPAGVDLRQQLSQLCAQRGWLVTSMRLEPVQLDDIFRKLRMVRA